jgi:hypothetical protein
MQLFLVAVELVSGLYLIATLRFSLMLASLNMLYKLDFLAEKNSSSQALMSGL